MNRTMRRCASLVLTALVLPVLAAAQDSTHVAVPSVPPPVLPPWRFQVDFGLQDIVGNRDLTVLSGGFVAEHRRQDRFILNNKVDIRYGRSNGDVSVNAQAYRFRFDWRPRDPVSPFLGVDMARDPIRKSAFRIQLGTGANLNLDVRDEQRTWLSLGLVADYQEFTAGVEPSTSRDTRIMLRAATVRLIGPGTRVELTAKLQPATYDVADYLASFDGSVRVGLSRRMGITTRLLWVRDSAPPEGVRPDDRELDVALSLAW